MKSYILSLLFPRLSTPKIILLRVARSIFNIVNVQMVGTHVPYVGHHIHHTHITHLVVLVKSVSVLWKQKKSFKN